MVRRIAEPAQYDTETMSRLRRAGVRPGAAVAVRLAGSQAGDVLVGSGGEVVELTRELASHVFVDAAKPGVGGSPVAAQVAVGHPATATVGAGRVSPNG